jgi:hypothetical protein
MTVVTMGFGQPAGLDREVAGPSRRGITSPRGTCRTRSLARRFAAMPTVGVRRLMKVPHGRRALGPTISEALAAGSHASSGFARSFDRFWRSFRDERKGALYRPDLFCNHLHIPVRGEWTMRGVVEIIKPWWLLDQAVAGFSLNWRWFWFSVSVYLCALGCSYSPRRLFLTKKNTPTQAKARVHGVHRITAFLSGFGRQRVSTYGESRQHR